MNYLRMVWRLWSKALGEKAHKKDHVADKVAILRSVIFTTYLITNCFIVAGVLRHWHDETKILIELHDNSNRNQDTYTERRNNLGMGGDIRAQRIY
jgi:hypothetical protein